MARSSSPSSASSAAALAVRLNAGRVEPDRLGQIAECSLLLPEFRQDLTALGGGSRQAGVEPQRRIIVGHGLFEPPKSREGIAAPHEGIGVGRIDPGRPVVGVERPFVIAEPLEDLPGAAVRGGQALGMSGIDGQRIQANRLREGRQRILIASEHHQGNSPVIVGGGKPRLGLDRRVEIGQGPRRLVRAEVDIPSLDVGLDVARLVAENGVEQRQGLAVRPGVVKPKRLDAFRQRPLRVGG